MIKDKIEHLNRYFINEDFELLKSLILNSSIDIPLIQNNLKTIPLDYETKDFDNSKFENHKVFIDVHILLKGRERIELNSEENLKSLIEYVQDDDYQLFQGDVKDSIVLSSGEFIILYPGEVHNTGNKVIEQESVKKIVVKIPFKT